MCMYEDREFKERAVSSSCNELQTSGACGLWCHQLEQDRSPGGCFWIGWGPRASSSDPCIVCTTLYWQTPIWSSGEKEQDWVTCAPCVHLRAVLCRWAQVRAVLPLCTDLAGQMCGMSMDVLPVTSFHTDSEPFQKPQLVAISVTVRQQLHLLLPTWQDKY